MIALRLRSKLWPFFSYSLSTLSRVNVSMQRSLYTGQCLRQTVTAGQQEPLVQCVEEGGIRTVILNNIKKRNALSLSMLESLKEAITRDVDNQDLMVIVLRSSGPVFSAGHDLKELRTEEGRDYHREVFERCTEVMKLVQDIPVPVIAEIRGLATAAGCQLVASCDIAVASENAKFATPGVNIGVFCHTPGIAVARSIPRKAALMMLFTGQPITAQDALVHGLVSKVVPDDCLEEETMEIARKIASNSRPVTAMGKSFFYRQVAMDRDSAYKCVQQVYAIVSPVLWCPNTAGGEMMLQNLRLRDSQEGINAFLQKRQPNWSHDGSTEK